MYTYMYVETNSKGIFSIANHRELIDKYSKEGFRFVTAVPIAFSGNGHPIKFDLIFEKRNLKQ